MPLKYVEPAIFELIKSLVGVDSDSLPKAYMQKAPQNETGPFIIMQRVDSDRYRHINGPSGIAEVSMQIDVYGQSYYEVKDIAANIESTLDGYRGTVYYGDNSPQDSVVIGGISLQNDFDILDETDEPILHRVSAVYLVTHEQ
jgi:hypothetical protein